MQSKLRFTNRNLRYFQLSQNPTHDTNQMTHPYQQIGLRGADRCNKCKQAIYDFAGKLSHRNDSKHFPIVFHLKAEMIAIQIRVSEFSFRFMFLLYHRVNFHYRNNALWFIMFDQCLNDRSRVTSEIDSLSRDKFCCTLKKYQF